MASRLPAILRNQFPRGPFSAQGSPRTGRRSIAFAAQARSPAVFRSGPVRPIRPLLRSNPSGTRVMNSIIYIVGLVVIVVAILSFLGLA